MKKTGIVIVSILAGVFILIAFDVPSFIVALHYPLEKIVSVTVEEKDTVSYEELEVEPEYLSSDQRWFANTLAPITLRKLKRYMKENDLVIVSGEYVFKTTTRLDEIIQILNFETVS